MKQKRYFNRTLYGNISIIVTTKRWAVLYKNIVLTFSQGLLGGVDKLRTQAHLPVHYTPQVAKNC
jgi:hypothetical protein